MKEEMVVDELVASFILSQDDVDNIRCEVTVSTDSAYSISISLSKKSVISVQWTLTLIGPSMCSVKGNF